MLDCLIDQGPRTGRTFSTEDSVKKFVAVLRQYRCTQVTGDSYAQAWPQQMFEKLGVAYRVSDLNRSQLYAAFEPLLNSANVELLDSTKLLAQLVGLVRKGEKSYTTQANMMTLPTARQALVCWPRL